MEENKQIKVSLKTVIIIICIIAVLVIGIIVAIKCAVKENRTVSSNSSGISQTEESYIYNEEIKSITIKYYEGYNIASGDIISDTIPLNTINLKFDDFNEVSNLIKVLTKVKYTKDDEIYSHIQYDHICDEYKLEINDNFIIYIGERIWYSS